MSGTATSGKGPSAPGAPAGFVPYKVAGAGFFREDLRCRYAELSFNRDG